MCDLKTAFFVSADGRGKVLRPQTGARTVFRYERAISRECRPRPTGKGKEKDFSPEYTGGRCSEKQLFSYTLLDGQKRPY